MKTNILQQNKLANAQINQSLTSSEPVAPITTQTDTAPTGGSAFLLPFFVAVMVGTIAIYLIKKVSKKSDETGVGPCLSRVPCPRCHYFSSNSYLRCAVHPGITMTKDAAECPDYIARGK